MEFGKLPVEGGVYWRYDVPVYCWSDAPPVVIGSERNDRCLRRYRLRAMQSTCDAREVRRIVPEVSLPVIAGLLADYCLVDLLDLLMRGQSARLNARNHGDPERW